MNCDVHALSRSVLAAQVFYQDTSASISVIVPGSPNISANLQQCFRPPDMLVYSKFWLPVAPSLLFQ